MLLRACEKMELARSNRTQELLVRYALGEAFEREAVEWACQLLEEGEDTPHLRYVAGYTEIEIQQDPEEFRRDFRLALEELNLPVPPQREEFNDLACFICESFLSGAIAYHCAHDALYQIWMDTTYNPRYKTDNRFAVWMYLSDSISLVTDGYPPLLDKFEGLSETNYQAHFRREAVEFLNQYGCGRLGLSN